MTTNATNLTNIEMMGLEMDRCVHQAIMTGISDPVAEEQARCLGRWPMSLKMRPGTQVTDENGEIFVHIEILDLDGVTRMGLIPLSMHDDGTLDGDGLHWTDKVYAGCIEDEWTHGDVMTGHWDFRALDRSADLDRWPESLRRHSNWERAWLYEL